MKQTRKSLALIAVASGVVFGLVAPLTASAEDGPAPSSLKWATCEGDGLDPRQECATVSVPMDYADPGGRKIDIAISRIRSEDPSARRGALLIVPGGPGGDSLTEPSTKGQKLPEKVRDAYDLIGFAPRGMIPSTSVTCDFAPGDLARTKLFPWPDADGSLDGTLATARRQSKACERDGGELIQHISTLNEARDLDRVRAALGERRISAWGLSYGSYAAATYAQLFPHRTDRFVLDSNPFPDPGVGAGRATYAGFEAGVEDTFPVFARWASAPERGKDRLARTAAEVRPLFLRLAARLDREPIPWPGANPEELNGTVLRQAMIDAFYDPDGFPGLAELINAAREGTVPPAPEAPPTDLLQNGYAVAVATLCNDAAWPRTAAGYQKGVTESRAKFPLTAGMPRSATACAAWPWAPKEAPVRITDQGPSNILLIQNQRDVATPVSGALKLRAALGERAVMVLVNSTGHDAYLGNGNACGDALVSHFLATGKRPARDTYCR
jgi:pimeloyl-ACP methyl ester carboxylesterase